MGRIRGEPNLGCRDVDRPRWCDVSIQNKTCTRVVEWTGAFIQICWSSRLVNVNATVTQAQSTASHFQVTSPTWEWLFTDAFLTGCQVTSRPYDRFSRCSKWLDTSRIGLLGKFFVRRHSVISQELWIHEKYCCESVEDRINLFLSNNKE